VNAINLLKEQAYLNYDGIRIRWTQDFCMLQNFIESSVRVAGYWKSPGGKAKQFVSTCSDFTMTWYPGKLNSLLFHGKDGESFKTFLVSVLESDFPEQTNTNTNASCLTTARYTDEAEPQLLGESREISNRDSIDPKQSSPERSTCACKIHITADLNNVKSDVAVLQKQVESINRVIDSTNSIIESMSVILNPLGTGSHCMPYDLRVEILLKEFSLVLDERNRQLVERDNTIKQLQERIVKMENQCQSASNESTADEQKRCHDNRNNEVTCKASKVIVSNIEADVIKLSTHNQTTDGNLHMGNNKSVKTAQAIATNHKQHQQNLPSPTMNQDNETSSCNETLMSNKVNTNKSKSTNKSPSLKWIGSLPLIETPNNKIRGEHSSENCVGGVKRNNNYTKHLASQQSRRQPFSFQRGRSNKVIPIQYSRNKSHKNHPTSQQSRQQPFFSRGRSNKAIPIQYSRNKSPNSHRTSQQSRRQPFFSRGRSNKFIPIQYSRNKPLINQFPHTEDWSNHLKLVRQMIGPNMS
jgi:hypothetical protein